MSWFRVKNNQHPDYTGLQISTATSTLPIAIVWGQTKLASNVVWYENFQTHGGGGGKGGLFGGSGDTGYSYTADLIMAVCEGPISGVGIIWRDQSTYTLAQLGLTLFDGTTPQTAWSYLSTNYPTQSLSYQGTAYFCAASYQLGDSANIGNHNFEIIGALAGTGINGIDADPAQVINDFLTNAQYGVGFASSSINAATLFGSGGDASLQTYCKAMGIAFSPALTSQEQGSSILSRWLQILNCAAVWSGGQLKFIPYGDQTIASGNVTQTVRFTVPTPVPVSSGTTPPPQLVVSTAANFVSDGGVAYAFTGTALTHTGTAPTTTGTYGISPAGTYVFSTGDENQVVNITFTASNPVSYVPNVTPIYSLTDLDYVDEKGNKDPVQASRVDPFSLATIQRIEVYSRGNQYGATPVEARDQSQIELYGPRVGSTIQAHEICDDIVIGPIVAQAILQRALYVRANFKFKLSWEYCLLDPMDIVTLTDANLGLSNYAVRIISIEEDDHGLLEVTCEELTVGVSTPAYYPSSGLAPAFQPNQAVAVQSINTPLIYEPPPAATGNVAQVWVGASGGSGGVADPNWGGAYVWISLDNVTYQQIATLSQPVKQGFLTANLAAATGFDVTNTLAVTVAESGAQLIGTSLAFAEQGQTLCLVDSELLAFETATLSGSYAYNLTGLQRGIDGTAGAAHLNGAAFARIELGSTVVAYDLPSNYIGVPLYFKFQSFNVFGSGVQSLAACAVYNYTPNGSGAVGAIAQALATGASLNFGNAFNVTQTENWGSALGGVNLTVNLGNASP